MKAERRIRYAVVGLGHIAQTAVLPAFVNASENSVLTALVSGDEKKLKTLGKKYGIEKLYRYSQFEECLRNGEVDAVYIATPNFYHRNIMETAAKYGVHVLCEKPMAITTEDCLSMIQVAEQNHTKLMIAYRLHFEAANLEAIALSQQKKLGQLRVFNSVFTMPVKDKTNIRLKDTEAGGGPLYDIGIYCINASRYLFRAEPIEVYAMEASPKTVAVTMKFPENRLANFTVSFDASASMDYDLIGTQGRLRLEQAYGYGSTMKLKVFDGQKTEEKVFEKRDQFGPELVYFSNCILRNKDPEPSGEEGLADVKIIEALLLSIELGSPVSLELEQMGRRPTKNQVITLAPVPSPKPINATDPGGS